MPEVEKAIGFILITIPTNNVAESFDFYVNTLGFDSIRQPDKHGVAFEIGTKNIERFYEQLKIKM